MILTQQLHLILQLLKLSKDFTPTLNTSTKYTIPFNNALYNPHSGHNRLGGILDLQWI